MADPHGMGWRELSVNFFKRNSAFLFQLNSPIPDLDPGVNLAVAVRRRCDPCRASGCRDSRRDSVAGYSDPDPRRLQAPDLHLHLSVYLHLQLQPALSIGG
ncbi:hypothetical protein SAY87_005678 [Trapa incisa]|uniref:Uncharacterized protein n=1 Tax=Trapa incisa TaxID=236973 RepID=A0AAN7K562_9MYRT|nr:hypothetical protein SAY87_005678 [Trapa incisa]